MKTGGPEHAVGIPKSQPHAVIECPQEIPCDPCVEACPHGAIRKEGSIASIPVLDEELCQGCGECIPACPGLAIFLVDSCYSEDCALVGLPHEMLPMPVAGERVRLLDRCGREVGVGTVTEVRLRGAYDRTAVVYVAVPRGLEDVVRAVAVLPPDDHYVCRCEEVTRQMIERAVEDGATTVDAVKRLTRAGMGLCQGRTCRRLVSAIIAEKTGKPLEEILPATTRPPLRPLP
ncbi:MAG: (2Fe-2S)-binding protein, partial [Candidatus Bipolaricaulota bacterium]